MSQRGFVPVRQRRPHFRANTEGAKITASHREGATTVMKASELAVSAPRSPISTVCLCTRGPAEVQWRTGLLLGILVPVERALTRLRVREIEG